MISSWNLVLLKKIQSFKAEPQEFTHTSCLSMCNCAWFAEQKTSIDVRLRSQVALHQLNYIGTLWYKTGGGIEIEVELAVSKTNTVSYKSYCRPAKSCIWAVVIELQNEGFQSNKTRPLYIFTFCVPKSSSGAFYCRLQKMKKLRSLLAADAEACNEWRDPAALLSAWAAQVRKNVAAVSTLCSV